MNQYTVTQAAAIVGKSVRTVRQAAELNEHIGKKIGSVWVLDDNDLELIRAMRQGGRIPAPKRKPRKRRAKPAPATATAQEAA